MNIHIKSSLENVRRAPFQALAAISVLTVTFFVSTLFAIIIYASQQTLHYYETVPKILAFIKNEAGSDDIEALRAKLQKDSRVKNVEFITKEQAKQIYEDLTTDNPLLGELVSPSILPSSIEFSVSDLSYIEELIKETEKENIVDEVRFSVDVGGKVDVSELIARLKDITLYVRIGGLVAALTLGGTSFLVLMIVIGMRITMKRKEVGSLVLIGAGPWFIRAPIILEAVNYCLVGVILGWMMASSLVMYLAPSLISYFGEIPILPANTLDFFLLLGSILLGELIVGLVIAVSGSLLAVSRSLRMVK